MITNDGNLANAKFMTLAKDAKIYYVDAYKSNSNERIIVSDGDGIVPSAETNATTYQTSVIYKTNNDGEISEIIVEIHGEKIWTNTELQDA